MIEQVTLRDLGVIAQATLPIGAGFTAITGETGAGKTMVVTGLGLLLGGRCGLLAAVTVLAVVLAGVADHGELAAHLYGVILLGDDLFQHTCGGGRDFGVDLVGRNLKQWLILLDRVSLLLQPAGDCPLGNALSECGHLDGDGHSVVAPLHGLSRYVSCRIPSCHVRRDVSPRTGVLRALALSK